MNIHKHARLTPRGRALLVQRILEHGLRVEEAAQACGVSVRTAYKWLARFRAEGPDELQNRASRPCHCPHATPAALSAQILEQRRQRQTYHQIARATGVGRATVGRLLRRAGLNRLAELEPAPPVHRYEYARCGELLHLDIKKLGRFWRPGHRVTGTRLKASNGAGWEHVHIAIDDHSRIAHATIRANERASSARTALLATLRYTAPWASTSAR